MKGMDLMEGVWQSFLPFLYLVGAVFVIAAAVKADCVNLIGAHRDGLIGTHL